jgi:hypothetical protein
MSVGYLLVDPLLLPQLSSTTSQLNFLHCPQLRSTLPLGSAEPLGLPFTYFTASIQLGPIPTSSAPRLSPRSPLVPDFFPAQRGGALASEIAN